METDSLKNPKNHEQNKVLYIICNKRLFCFFKTKQSINYIDARINYLFVIPTS